MSLRDTVEQARARRSGIKLSQPVISLREFQMARMNAGSAAMLQKYCKGKSYKAVDYVLGQNFP